MIILLITIITTQNTQYLLELQTSQKYYDTHILNKTPQTIYNSKLLKKTPKIPKNSSLLLTNENFSENEIKYFTEDMTFLIRFNGDDIQSIMVYDIESERMEYYNVYREILTEEDV